MSRSIRSVFVLSSFVALLLAVPTSSPAERGMALGATLPAHSLRTLDGATVAVPSDKLTVVVFWSTWSPRSEVVLKYWADLKGEIAAEHPFDVVALNADSQDMTSEKIEAVKAYLSEKAVTLPVVIDDKLTVYEELGVKTVPTSYFVKADGTLAWDGAGFPISAREDYRASLEKELGIAAPASEATAEGSAPRGQLAYQPKNNALLYYGMGVNLAKMKMKDKARGKYAEALQRDPEYADPLQALADDFFREGKTPEAEQKFKDFLTEKNLSALVEKVSSLSAAPNAAPAPARVPVHAPAPTVEPAPAP